MEKDYNSSRNGSPGPPKEPILDSNEVHIVNYMRSHHCCGEQGHIVNKCRFHQVSCYKCGKQGHLQVMCKECVKFPGGSDKLEVKQLIPEVEDNNDTTIQTITGGMRKVIKYNSCWITNQ